MTKENEAELEAEAKAKVEESKAKAEETETKDAEDDDSEESDDSQKKATDVTTDYEAELKKEREAREKAEKAAADSAFKLRQAKREKEEENYEEEEEKPLTSSQLKAILDQERQVTQKIVQEARIGEVAGKWATTESEKNLLIEIHKNRTFPQHLSLDEQFEEVYAIANRKKLIGERNEAMRALKGKDGVNDNPSGTHHDPLKGSEPQLNPKDKKVFTELGYSYNATTRRYEKKIKNGNLHYIDPKTKKLVIVKK